LQDDERALSIVRQWQPAAEFVRPEIHEGEFILFDGNLWHASDNPGSALCHAMGLRYSPPDQRVRIPLTAWEPTVWDPAPPPTAMVRGEDHYRRNRRI
jgi:ectoine hydroxylase-related dioxygenase (phytanoyl-CoA dioxygenase family)